MFLVALGHVNGHHSSVSYYVSFSSVHIAHTCFYLNGVMGTLFYQSKPQILMAQQLWKGEGGQATGCQSAQLCPL